MSSPENILTGFANGVGNLGRYIAADLVPPARRASAIGTVVWGATTETPSGPLTAEQLASFDTNGFLWLENVFSEDEVRSFRDEMDRMTNDPVIRESEVSIIELASDTVRSIFEIQHEFCEARRHRDTLTGYRAMRQ